MEIALIRKAHFNAAHRLYVESWSEEENMKRFGRCANPHYHGHNYNLEVKVIGNIDPVSGILIDLETLKAIIKDEIEDRYDHKNLNEQLPEFKAVNPTVENIAIEIYKRILPKLPSGLKLQIKLYETERNIAIYPALL